MVLIAGVDEAGRGSLAGSVYAAAVILDPQKPIMGLKDSKQLSARKRTLLATIIKRDALSWAIAYASVDEIDGLNILQATLLAMRRAVSALTVYPHEILVDGVQIPEGLAVKARAIVKGDTSEAAISAASILAKTARDAQLVILDKEYPQYGFAQHKGYPTAQHIRAISDYGVLPIHRKNFAPVKRYLAVPVIGKIIC